MAVKIQYTDNLSRDHGCKLTVYGDSGNGKTRLGASAPRPLFISAEKGLMSLQDFHLPAVEVKNLGDLADIFMMLTKSNESKNYDTIILDSMSEIAEVVFAAEQKKQADPRKLYPIMENKVTECFRSFRDIAGKHVVLICKQAEIKDDTGRIRYRPALPGNKLPIAAPYFTDEVFHIKRWKDVIGLWGIPEAVYWLLRTQPNDEYIAKDRSSRLLEIENADPLTGGGLTYIFNKMTARL